MKNLLWHVLGHFIDNGFGGGRPTPKDKSAPINHEGHPVWVAQ
jgi:hypothetical protein